MKRIIALLALVGLFTSNAFATTEFNKEWKAMYLTDDTSEEFSSAAKKAGCNVCHVKDKDKKKERNEYGKAVNEFLKSKDFPKEFIKENPEKAKEMIQDGLKKAAEKKSSDGQPFGEKIKAGKLPATDSGL